MAAFIKGITMALFGIWVIAATILHSLQQTLPEAITMGKVGCAALTANAAVFALLWVYRKGDSNMRSVWLCSRNDVIGNFTVLLAALGVFGTRTGLPDVTVAGILACLGLQGAFQVIRQALGELRVRQIASA